MKQPGGRGVGGPHSGVGDGRAREWFARRRPGEISVGGQPRGAEGERRGERDGEEEKRFVEEERFGASRGILSEGLEAICTTSPVVQYCGELVPEAHTRGSFVLLRVRQRMAQQVQPPTYSTVCREVRMSFGSRGHGFQRLLSAHLTSPCGISAAPHDDPVP